MAQRIELHKIIKILEPALKKKGGQPKSIKGLKEELNTRVGKP